MRLAAAGAGLRAGAGDRGARGAHALNLRDRVNAEVRSQAAGQADVVAASAADLLAPRDRGSLDALVGRAANAARGRVIVVDRRGRVLSRLDGHGRSGRELRGPARGRRGAARQGRAAHAAQPHAACRPAGHRGAGRARRAPGWRGPGDAERGGGAERDPRRNPRPRAHRAARARARLPGRVGHRPQRGPPAASPGRRDAPHREWRPGGSRRGGGLAGAALAGAVVQRHDRKAGPARPFPARVRRRRLAPAPYATDCRCGCGSRSRATRATTPSWPRTSMPRWTRSTGWRGSWTSSWCSVGPASAIKPASGWRSRSCCSAPRSGGSPPPLRPGSRSTCSGRVRATRGWRAPTSTASSTRSSRTPFPTRRRAGRSSSPPGPAGWRSATGAGGWSQARRSPCSSASTEAGPAGGSGRHRTWARHRSRVVRRLGRDGAPRRPARRGCGRARRVAGHRTEARADAGMRWAALALVGLVLAAAITVAARQLSGQPIGLQSQPISAGRSLAAAAQATPRPGVKPPPRIATTPPRTVTSPPPARTVDTAPTARPRRRARRRRRR